MISSWAPRKAVRPKTELSKLSASRATGASLRAGALAETDISNLVGSGEAETVEARFGQVHYRLRGSQLRLLDARRCARSRRRRHLRRQRPRAAMQPQIEFYQV